MVTHELNTSLQQWVKGYEDDPIYLAEGYSSEVMEEVAALLRQRNLTQSWLAHKMGVSRAHVSRILNAPANMTFLSVAKMALAFGVKFRPIFNSDMYFIKAWDENVDYEEFETEQAIKWRNQSMWDAQATTNPVVDRRRGAILDATG